MDCAHTRMKVSINLSSMLLSTALAELLERHPEICELVAPQVEKAGAFEPDLVLLDASVLESSDPAWWPGAKRVLVDTGIPEVEIVRLLVAHRLHGVISTSTDLELFKKALQAICDDQVWVDNNKLKALINLPLPTTAPVGPGSFSPREREIVFLIAAGRRNREIAEQLKLSEQTVKSHIEQVFQKSRCREPGTTRAHRPRPKDPAGSR